ncbi:MAG TPA: hydroxymethylbilane synthase [Candidatus Dormibacteraeota bacterium]|nr:hydroxymethylbilane synthase [Candidatus Dormibacteraeota bacterium]
MTGSEIAIGSRGSALALAQARAVRDALARLDRPSRIVVIETDGDRRAPDSAWGEGAFVAAIERALLGGQVDAAVHSAKDVPTAEDPRLRIGAFLPRADPRDALVVRAGAAAHSLDDLPPGARVGTDSPRRAGFVLAMRPDVEVRPLHGNVDTRLRRLEAGEADALILACAGLDRLGLGDRIAVRLEPASLPPAPGQGAIAVQARSDDAETLALLSEVDDRRTRLAVETERAFLHASGGGCRSPIGALATLDGDQLVMLGGYARTDGSDTVIARRTGPASSGEMLARQLADELGAGGADGGEPWRMRRGRVLVLRTAEQAGELVARLRQVGLEPIAVPTIAIEAVAPGGELDLAAARLSTYAWVVVTSGNGARAVVDAAARMATPLSGPKWAAIGTASTGVLADAGVTPTFQPAMGSSSAVGAGLPLGGGDRILVVGGNLADERLASTLRGRGAMVDVVTGYQTLEAPLTSRDPLRRAIDGGPLDAIVFTSGSTVRGLVTLAAGLSIHVTAIPAVCIGPETATHAKRAGFRVVAISPTPDSTTLAETTASALRSQLEETR